MKTYIDEGGLAHPRLSWYQHRLMGINEQLCQKHVFLHLRGDDVALGDGLRPLLGLLVPPHKGTVSVVKAIVEHGTWQGELYLVGGSIQDVMGKLTELLSVPESSTVMTKCINESVIYIEPFLVSWLKTLNNIEQALL